MGYYSKLSNSRYSEMVLIISIHVKREFIIQITPPNLRNLTFTVNFLDIPKVSEYNYVNRVRKAQLTRIFDISCFPKYT